MMALVLRSYARPVCPNPGGTIVLSVRIPQRLRQAVRVRSLELDVPLEAFTTAAFAEWLGRAGRRRRRP